MTPSEARGARLEHRRGGGSRDPRLARAFALVVTLLLPAVAAAQGRFALAIGENRGLVDDAELRFAPADAQRVADTLVDVGGFQRDDVAVLAGANAGQVRAALAALKARLGDGPHERLVLYVSSHAADGALHLSGSTLPLAELVEFVRRAPVQVGVLIIDACQSGSVTRLKGLKPSSVPLTRLEASGVEGRVLISASGADEYAQESDALQGSTFTHYLLAGLRGAADSSRDGKVTLDEVYGWAWARTIEATFSSRGGVQRPAFSVDLKGQGQLVLAEPAKSDARLTLDVRPAGRWLVVSETTGTVFADVEKAEGALTLAVPPGRYRLQLRVADGVLERAIEVPAQGGVTVAGGDLEKASLLRVARKGGEESRLVLSLGGGVASGLVRGLVVQPGAELRLRRDGFAVGPINQAHVTFGWRDGRSVTGQFLQTELELRAGGGHRFAWRAASLALGLELGPLLVLQHALPDTTSRTGLGLAGVLSLETRVRLAGPVEAFLLGTGGGTIIKKLEGVSVTPRLAATLGLALTL